MQLECPNCGEHLQIGSAGCEASFDADGTWQVRGGWDLEIVYHECSGGPLFSIFPFYGVGVPPREDDGSAGVPARPPEPLRNPGGSMQRDVGES